MSQMSEMTMRCLSRSDGGTHIEITSVSKPVKNLLLNRREYFYRFRKILEPYMDRDHFLVTINSCGGSLDSAMGMCAALAMINKPMKILINGECGSAATLLLELCAPCYITPTGHIFIHNPSRQRFKRGKDGEYQLIATENWASKVAKSYMMAAYRGRTARYKKKARKKTIREWMDNGTRFDANEAVEKGLCDGIMSSYEFIK